MTNEQQIDWQHLESDYRAGVLSLRFLAAKYGCSLGAITRRAKRDGWRRVLVEQVGIMATRENSPREHHVAVGMREHARENTTLSGENTTRENTLREQPVRENTGREHPKAVTTGENSAGENTRKENTGENSKTGCSLAATPEREQPRANDVLTLGMEYREAQRQYGSHLAHCRLAASGSRRCSLCLELSIQREVTLQRFKHAKFLG